ncbi:hypothetical protein [Aliagarivorans taiwanensis]|uniref:hypothetical protein n=1 Tax=Aliagarivorans taiwanensis TaxID=561966 RepID=UPI000407A9DF|nr:hypothetical protein [Aliagarivorans taiwanensis]
MKKAIILSILVVISSAQGQPLKASGSSNGQSLPNQLLDAIVERSDIYDSVEYPYGEAGDSSFARTQADLDDGKLDLLWTATSKDYEEQMQAVYFPLYRGTLGMRLGIVRSNDQQALASVTTLQQLRQHRACQGKLWADTAILEANGIPVAKSLGYFNIFAMLDAERCRYFPRAIFEPWAELERESKYPLSVDSHIMLRYKMPFFFFTKKGNQQVAQHIEEILYQMFADGSFQAMFFNHPDVKNALELGQLKQRKIFDLTNPNLTERVQQIPSEVWFDPLAGE